MNCRHAVGKVIRRRAPWVPLKPMWRCTTNNYALVKAPGARELAVSHLRAIEWFERARPAAAPGARERHEPHACLPDLARVPRARDLPPRAAAPLRALPAAVSRARPGPDWCAPYLARMDALMGELELR